MAAIFTRRDVLLAVAAYFGTRRVGAQDEPVFSTEVKVVNVLATVRDGNGALITGLSQEDFALSEDGRPQTIRYFSRETDLPLTLGLAVDTSASQRRVMDAERGATLRFLDSVVRPGFSDAIRQPCADEAASHLFSGQTRGCPRFR